MEERSGPRRTCHYTRSKQKLLHASCYDSRLICFQHLVFFILFILRGTPPVGAFRMPFATLSAGLFSVLLFSLPMNQIYHL